MKKARPQITGLRNKLSGAFGKAFRINLLLFLAAIFCIAIGPFVASAFDSIDKGKSAAAHPFRDGDIIFQTSQSGQSLAISYATHSKYTHCGLLFNDNGNWFVYEAVGPVKKTPFNDWIQHGDSSYYIVRRLAKADSVLTADATTKMRESIGKRIGIGYDFWFGWNDSLIYCSELVWKAYNESVELEVGQLKPMKEYDLTHPLVMQTMKKRYGDAIPYEELMISPGDVFDSPLLFTVTEGIK